MSAEDLRLLQTQIETIRGDSGFDYVVGGARPHADRDRERRYIETMAEGGATYGRQEFVANRMSQNGVSDQMAPGFRPAIVCRRRVPTHTVPRLVAQVALTLISVTTLCGCSPASNSRSGASPQVQTEAAPDLAVLSAAVDKYVYVTVKRHSDLFNEPIRLNYSRTEQVNTIGEIENNIARECLRGAAQSIGAQSCLLNDGHLSWKMELTWSSLR